MAEVRKGHGVGNFPGFRFRGQKKAERHGVVLGLPAAHNSQIAQESVMAKINAMGEKFFAMPKAEFDDWINALPRDEFIEYIALAST